MTRRTNYLRRTAINAQIVVAGASETGLATLERLLMDTTHQFNYLTLLAPGGIQVGGVACQYTAGGHFLATIALPACLLNSHLSAYIAQSSCLQMLV